MEEQERGWRIEVLKKTSIVFYLMIEDLRGVGTRLTGRRSLTSIVCTLEE